MTIGSRISQRRQHLGLTQEDVARHFGIAREAIAQWETGKTAPRGSRLTALAELLRCSTQWLLTGKGEAVPVPTLREERLLSRFRMLADPDRETVEIVAERLLHREGTDDELAQDRKKGQS